MKYNPLKIEKKWAGIWEKKKAWKTDLKKAKKPYYNLMMFPYPSAEGLHVGNVYAFTGSDIHGRFRRMQGFDVFEPMGFDSFGIHSENFAIKKGVHPKVQTAKNIKNFTKQLSALGALFDWDRAVTTSEPDYYKWTQWLFLQLYKAGLAYRAKAPVDWCPSCKTVLADEQVINGKCERCDSQVIQKEMEQWFFRITKYADRLLKNLETIDWSERTKIAQKNWIGKSEGAELAFPVEDSKLKIKVFTTRPDTLFGATYMVLAPEHALVDQLKTRISNWSEVQAYRQDAKRKSELERTELSKNKTGIELKGIKAINPANKEEIPIFIADYVLATYGTGAIMAVPAHDERDREFALKYGLPSKQVVAPYTVVTGTDAPRSDKDIFRFDAATAVIKHWKENNLFYVVAFTDTHHGLVGGHTESGEKPEQTALREVKEESGYTDIKDITLLFECAYSRGYKTRKQREELCRDSIYVVELRSDKRIDIIDHETKKGSWMTAEEILRLDSFVTHHKLYFEHFIHNKSYTMPGKLVNSGKFNDFNSERAKWKITEFAGGVRKVQYHLRDWLISRQRYWGPSIPIIYCKNCGIVPVPEKDLPVKLPFVKNFRPTGTGKSPLASVQSFVKTKCPRCKGPAERETDVSDTFLDSAWYYLRYPSVGVNSSVLEIRNLKLEIPWNQQITRLWLPVDMYIGGQEHAVLHLLYTRFITMALKDLGLIEFSEPFKKFRAHGLLTKDGAKMSKSKGNVVNPDEYFKKYGADTIRMYLMFIGPFSEGGDWSDKGIVGIYRFLNRIWELVQKSQIHPVIRPGAQSDDWANSKLESLRHKTIKKVTEDLENLRYNTAIASLMEYFNEISKQQTVNSKQDIETLLVLLAPFAPYITEELFLGVHNQPWPKYDARLIKEKRIKLVLQVNGKVRDIVEVSSDVAEEQAKKAALGSEKIQKWISGKTVKKVIFVPGRLINIVV